MIQTTIPAEYGKNRTDFKKAIIQITISSATMKADGAMFTVENHAVLDGGALVFLEAVEKQLSQEEYNQLFAAVSQMIQAHDTSELTRFELERLRHKLGLFIFVTNDFIKDENGDNTGLTVWKVLPNQWQLM